MAGPRAWLRVNAMTATMKFAETTYPAAVAKGWHSDPQNLHDLRFHDGRQWTEHVTHFGPVPCQGCHSAAA